MMLCFQTYGSQSLHARNINIQLCPFIRLLPAQFDAITRRFIFICTVSTRAVASPPPRPSCRRQVTASVSSFVFTCPVTSVQEYTTGADGQVSPVPYFVLVNKIHRERNADADRANDTARSTAVELGEARAALAESKACLVALEAEKAVTEERLSEMKENSASLQDCVDRTDQRIAEAQEIADRAAAKQADRIAELEEELAATKADLADANIHRTCQCHLTTP